MSEQKPVAWMHLENGEVTDFFTEDYKEECEECEHCVPLYTAPPKREWVGFNKSELSVLIGVAQFADDAEKFIKYVEAKLKEKNT